MRQSLAGAAARGMSTSSIAKQKRELLAAGDIEGLMALNSSLYGTAVMVAKDDADDDSGDDDTDDGGDDDEDEDDEDEDGDEDKGTKKPDARARRIQHLAAESKRHRLRARDYRRELEEAKAELEKLKSGKGKAKDDKAEDASEDDEQSTKLKSENEELRSKLVAQQLRSEFNDLTSGSNALAKFKNPKTAFKLLDLNDVEIEDDEIIGLEDAIKALVKSDPYLVDDGKADDDEDDEDDDEVTARRRRRSTGQATGGRGKKTNPNREKLVSKYPALRR